MIIEYSEMKRFKSLVLAVFMTVFGLGLIGKKGLPQNLQPKIKSEIKKKAVVEQNSRIIHLDLLTQKRRKFQPPLRNIFLPQLKGIKKLRDAMLAMEKEGAGSEALPGSSPEKTGQVQDNASNIFLQYIGFIKSPERIVALVVYQGQPWVVRVGDVLVDGSEVSAISEEEIEITGPDKKKKTFRLIEEKP